MIERGLTLLIAGSLAACADPDDTRLIDQAHSAVLDLLNEPVSARFDDSGVFQDSRQGLVCGGLVRAKGVHGERLDYSRYFFLRGPGAAVDPSGSGLLANDPLNEGGPPPLLLRLKQACDELASRRAVKSLRTPVSSL